MSGGYFVIDWPPEEVRRFKALHGAILGGAMSDEAWTVTFQRLVRHLEDATATRARLRSEMDQAEREQNNARAELREHWDKWSPQEIKGDGPLIVYCPECAGPLSPHWWCGKCGGYPEMS